MIKKEDMNDFDSFMVVKNVKVLADWFEWLLF